MYTNPGDNYYPFGLQMAGISSKAANITLNKENTFQGQRFDDDLGVNYYSFKYRNHDPQIGRFIQIDPLSDKYVYNSTYAFSENKVINGVELEGLEVVLINEKKDPAIYKAGVANTDKSAVHIYAHGTPSNMDVSGNNSWSNKKEDFQGVLNKSDVYQENKNSKDLTVIIHSCRAGRSYTDEKGNYIPSYAENMSAAFPNLTIIAPDERDAFSSSGKELGPRQIDDPKNNRGDYKDGAAHTINNKSGNWNVFKNGKFTGSYSASDYDAQTAPSWFERNFQFTPNQNPSTGINSSQTAPMTKEEEKKN